ncbi:hypothetical protein CJ030_MR4G028680 [Morella rubra]|uniref:Uncharacterized protein n=1 Tax=Morella rubra TaxID=262757 RepID=A0A6A1VV30_9ROSI|nr:hypothetical protein CJ030_MR4G028680 [Morella rubra]
MRFFRRIAGFLGFVKDDGHEPNDEDDDNNNNNPGSDSLAPDRAHFQETGAPRRGFGVPVQVVVDRPQLGPVLVPCNPGDGGVQVNDSLLSPF